MKGRQACLGTFYSDDPAAVVERIQRKARHALVEDGPRVVVEDG